MMTRVTRPVTFPFVPETRPALMQYSPAPFEPVPLFGKDSKKPAESGPPKKGGNMFWTPAARRVYAISSAFKGLIFLGLFLTISTNPQGSVAVKMNKEGQTTVMSGAWVSNFLGLDEMRHYHMGPFETSAQAGNIDLTLNSTLTTKNIAQVHRYLEQHTAEKYQDQFDDKRGLSLVKAYLAREMAAAATAYLDANPHMRTNPTPEQLARMKTTLLDNGLGELFEGLGIEPDLSLEVQ